MKKLISLALAIFMVVSLTTVVFATELTDPTGATTPSSGTIDDTVGSITINDVAMSDGKPVSTNEIYQLLKLKSFDASSGSYFYKYTSDEWATFFTTGDGKDYITLNDKGLIEWKGSSDAERVASFAKLALSYAENKNIAPTKTTETKDGAEPQYTINGNSLVFENLELGYYLIDSSVGALCGLSTTNPNSIINSKNGTPTIEKQVKGDPSEKPGKTNSAEIGQTLYFNITINAQDGAQNYVLHDTMEEGLTFDQNSVVVKLVDGVTGDPKDISAAGNFEVVLNGTDDCTFEVIFSKAFCDSLKTNDRLIVTYSAMLNENAEIGNGTAENPANENKTHLSYGQGHKTQVDSTTTKTYGFDLVKTDGENKLLDGSKFKIYSAETGGVEVTVVPMTDAEGNVIKTDDGYNMYRKAKADETGDTIIVDKGKVRVIGLDNGIYWLEETKAPNGYNSIAGRQKFTIADNNLDAIITEGVVSNNSGVQVINNKGSMLPVTGGMGTIMFITFGMIVVLGAGVLLVTKKRMSMIQVGSKTV